MRQYEAQLEADKVFSFNMVIQNETRVDLDPGVYETKCLRCNFTCHFPCTLPQDKMRECCNSMGVNMETGKVTHCLTCPSKCLPMWHVNNPYRFIVDKKKETRSSYELRAKYEQVTRRKLNCEGIVKEIINEFNKERANILELIKKSHKCILGLGKSSSNSKPLGISDYIDLLITTERKEARPGHIQRIKFLEDTQGKAELAEKLKESFDPFVEYMKEFEIEGFNISLFDPDSDDDYDYGDDSDDDYDGGESSSESIAADEDELPELT